MKAVRLVRHQNPLETHILPIPTPGAGDVLVAVKAAGICHTDVHYRAGLLSATLPVTPGHEVAGVVEAVGSQVKSLKPGDRVCLHYLASCGSCPECLSGHDQFCPHGEMIGKQRDGGYAEYIVMPARSVIRLPENIPFPQGAVAMCSAATSFHALNKSRLRPGEKVAIIGLGGLGMSAIQLARVFGALDIIAIDIQATKLARAEAFGAIPINAATTDPVGEVRHLTNGRGVDVCIDLVGIGATTRQAVQLLAPRGRAVVTGISREEVTLDLFSEILGKEAELIGCSDHLLAELPALIQLVSRGRVDLSHVVSRSLPLDAAPINAALDELEHGGDTVRNVITP